MSDQKFLKMSKTYIISWYHFIVFYNLLINTILPMSNIYEIEKQDFDINKNISYLSIYNILFYYLGNYIFFSSFFTGLASLAFFARFDIYNIIMNTSYLFINSILKIIINISYLNDMKKYSNITFYKDIVKFNEYQNIDTFVNIVLPLLCINIYVCGIIYYYVKRRVNLTIQPQS